MKVYLIWLSVSQSNYVNIVSKCKVLRDLGEWSSDSVSALEERMKILKFAVLNIT